MTDGIRQHYLLLVSAAAGAVVLALQVLAARVIAPALGSGSIIWSILLAVALGTLALGNMAGGLLSQRSNATSIIVWSLTISSACLLPLSQFHAAVMRWLIDAPLTCGALAAAMFTQAAPLGMMGLVTPIILNERKSTAGRWAGSVLAAGSGGGIVGALACGLFLLPVLGITYSYLTLSATLALFALPAAWSERRWLAVALLAGILALVCVGWRRHQPRSAVQSQYGQIEIRQVGLSLVLFVDGLPQTGLPPQLAPGDALRRGYLLEAALVVRPEISHALVIGLGAGLAPRILEANHVRCHSVEIDPKIIEIARNEFAFDGPATPIDGRSFLTHDSQRYDLIFLDVCTSERLAWHLFTVEGLSLLRARLTPTGIVVIQFIGDDDRWSASVARTVHAVFGNCQILAAHREAHQVAPRWAFAMRETEFSLADRHSLSMADAPWQVVSKNVDGYLLTDDHFSAELDWARSALMWRSLVAE